MRPLHGAVAGTIAAWHGLVIRTISVWHCASIRTVIPRYCSVIRTTTVWYCTRICTATTLRGYTAGVVLLAPVGASHLSEMLVLLPRTVPFLIASERRHARSASNTIQAKRSVVIRRDVEDRRSVVEHADIRKAEDVLRHDLSFRGLPSRASLAYTGVNRHATDTRIGLMDSTVPVEAVVDRN